MNGKRRNAGFRTRAGRIIDSRRRGSIRWLFPSVTGCNRWKKARGGRGKRGERLVSGRIRGKGKPEGGGIRCSALENRDALLPRESHFLASTPLVYLASFIISTARLLPSPPPPCLRLSRPIRRPNRRVSKLFLPLLLPKFPASTSSFRGGSRLKKKDE